MEQEPVRTIKDKDGNLIGIIYTTVRVGHRSTNVYSTTELGLDEVGDLFKRVAEEASAIEEKK